ILRIPNLLQRSLKDIERHHIFGGRDGTCYFTEWKTRGLCHPPLASEPTALGIGYRWRQQSEGRRRRSRDRTLGTRQFPPNFFRRSHEPRGQGQHRGGRWHRASTVIPERYVHFGLCVEPGPEIPLR